MYYFRADARIWPLTYEDRYLRGLMTEDKVKTREIDYLSFKILTINGFKDETYSTAMFQIASRSRPKSP